MSNRQEITRELQVKVTLDIVENLDAAINVTRKQDVKDKLIKAKEDILDILYPKDGGYNREEPK